METVIASLSFFFFSLSLNYDWLVMGESNDYYTSWRVHILRVNIYLSSLSQLE